MAIDTRNMNQVLAELRATSAAAAGKAAPAASVAEAGGAGGADFAAALRTAIDEVNAAQKSATQMSQEFATGDSNVNLQDVMVNLQKASLSFQQMVQVRNKLVNAYQEIMNIPV